MLLVPNNLIIVPLTYDMYFFMPNQITTLDGTERQASEIKINGTVTEVPVSFLPRSTHFFEVYSKGSRPNKGIRLINYGNYNNKKAIIPFQDFYFEKVLQPTIFYGPPDQRVLPRGYQPGILKFFSPLRGPSRVFYENIDNPEPEYTNDPAKKGLVIRFQNIQGYDFFNQRFTPDNYAAGQPATPPAGNVHPFGAYNTEIASRIGTSVYAEPIAVTQPLWGYVRPTQDRKGLLYVPYRNFQGTDAFTYTLLTQHNQIGLVKTITVDVYGNAPPVTYSLTSDKALIYPGETANIILTTTSVPPETAIPFRVYGDGIFPSDFQFRSSVLYEIDYSMLRGAFYLEHDKFTSNINQCVGVLPLTAAYDQDIVNEVFTVEINEGPDGLKTTNVTIVTLDVRITANKLTAFEGDEIEFTLTLVKTIPTLANIPNNTIIPFEIEYGGYNTVSNVYVGDTLKVKGEFTVVDNTARYLYTVPFSNQRGIPL